MAVESVLYTTSEGRLLADSIAPASTDPRPTTRRSCLSFWMYSRVRAMADRRSWGHGPSSSISKVGERTKAVDPVVIDRGSGHKAFAMFPASGTTSTSSNLRGNIVDEGIVVTGTTGKFIYKSEARLRGSSRLFSFSLGASTAANLLLGHGIHRVQVCDHPSRIQGNK